MKLFQFIVGISAFALLCNSCGGSKDRETQTETQDSIATGMKDTTQITVEDTILFKFDFAVANIPSPATLIYDIQKMGKSYDKSYLNDAQKAQGFPSEFKRAFNMGVFNIDMAYAVVNNMGADVLEYLKGIMILSDGLGLRNTVNSLIGKRAETNLSNKDSLFTILDDIYTKSDEYLRTNKRVYVASIIFTGSWIEILYLNSKMGENTKDPVLKAKIYKLLWEQRFHLGNILNLLKDHRGDVEFYNFVGDLTKLHQLIADIKDVSQMTDKKYEEIYVKLNAIRTQMTN